ncbi:MAG: hypothetical protein ABI298_05150, partial [Acidimicrobiales bacterium]
YGDELIAMIEDTIGDERPKLRFRWGIARTGLRERGHASGLLGAQQDACSQVRAGALLILCSWSAFVIAGAMFQKQSEHSAQAVPVASRTMVTSVYDLIAGMGALGSLAVVVGIFVALPPFISFVKNGGWRQVRRHVVAASLLSLATVPTLFGLKVLAHGLSVAQRNGADFSYSLAFVAFALLVCAAIIGWTVVGVVSVRRMTLSRRVLRFEARLAYLVAFSMVVITGAIVVWWVLEGIAAPSFFQGNGAGGTTTPNLIVIVVLMLTSSLCGLFGSARILHGWQRI